MVIESGDTVTLQYIGRLDDGTVFDTSRKSVADDAGLVEAQPNREFGPLTVEMGTGRLIEGLEEAIAGREEGESFTVTIPPEAAYGEWTEDQVREFEAAEFGGMVDVEDPEEGALLETQDGHLAEIVHLGDDVVRVDFNDQLAGETLEFDVEILEVR